MKYTQYFLVTRQRPDRSPIALEWIARVVSSPEHEFVQADGRILRWKRIDEAEGRFLRVVLLEDGKTVRNVFLIGVSRYEYQVFSGYRYALHRVPQR